MSRASKRLWLASKPLRLTFIVALAAAGAGAATIGGTARAAGPISQEAYDRCRAIPDEKARLACFEALTSPQQQGTPSPSPVVPDMPHGPTSGFETGPSSIPVAGKWRLVRTPDPLRGKDILSIMTTAELSGSDLDFAGLNLRCADQDFEVLIILISPLPPLARPTIAINGKKFQGSVVLPGTAILLPPEASGLARNQWRSLPKLSIDVEDDNATKVHGLLSLEGFNAALQTLIGACSTR